MRKRKQYFSWSILPAHPGLGAMMMMMMMIRGAPVSGSGEAGWLQKAALDLDPDAPSFPSPCIVLHSTMQEKRPHLFFSCLVKYKRNVLWYCES